MMHKTDIFKACELLNFCTELVQKYEYLISIRSSLRVSPDFLPTGRGVKKEV